MTPWMLVSKALSACGPPVEEPTSSTRGGTARKRPQLDAPWSPAAQYRDW